MPTINRQPVPYTVHDGLAVYRIDSGEPILLMPAPHRFEIPADGSAAPLIDGLRGLGRQVISFDPPSSGNSTRPMRLSMSEMHECADEALDVCGVSGPVDTMGHSMGGLTVLAYALERPQRVGRLVLIGTGSGGLAYMNAPGALWKPPSLLARWYTSKPAYTKAPGASRSGTHPAFWRMAALAILHIVWPRLAPERMLNNFIRHHSFYDKSLAEPEEVSLRDWLRPNKGRTDWHRIARKLDYAPRLGEIKVPALVLCGRHDPVYAPACSEELAASIENARLIWFERSGHFPFIEEPEAFWEEVSRFLAGTQSPRDWGVMWSRGAFRIHKEARLACTLRLPLFHRDDGGGLLLQPDLRADRAA